MIYAHFNQSSTGLAHLFSFALSPPFHGHAVQIFLIPFPDHRGFFYIYGTDWYLQGNVTSGLTLESSLAASNACCNSSPLLVSEQIGQVHHSLRHSPLPWAVQLLCFAVIDCC